MSEENSNQNKRGKYSTVTNEARQRIIGYYLSGAVDFDAFCSTMKLKKSTTRSIIATYIKTGKVNRQNPKGRTATVVTNAIKDAIIHAIDENCCIPLDQIRNKLLLQFPESRVPSVSTIFRTINGLFYSIKKVQISPTDLNSITTINERHEYADWMIRNRDVYNFVYVGESGFNLWEKRIFGRSMVGTPTIMVVDGQRGCNISLILGINSLIGNVYHEIYNNSVNSTDFLHYITHLCEKLHSLSSQNPFCIILDDCSIYKTKEILDYLGESGIQYHFLPPWSPFLNPIEESFSSIKTRVRSNLASFDWSKENIIAEANRNNMTLINYRYFLINSWLKNHSDLV